MTNPNKLADALKLIERMRFAIQGSYFTTGRGEHVSLPHQLDPSDLAALDKEAAAFLAEHDAQPATGEWVWVPREATEAMCDAGNDGAAPYMVDAKVLWRQMIAAAPQRAPAPVQVCPQCNNTGMMMIGDAQGLCWCPAGDKEREARGLPPDAHPPAPAADECLDCAYNPGLCDEHDNGGKPLHPPAADGAGPHVATLEHILKYHYDYPVTFSMERAALTAAIAALRQPVSDAVRTFTTGHCKNNAQPGGCQLHNLQCGYPACDRRPIDAQQESRP